MGWARSSAARGVPACAPVPPVERCCVRGWKARGPGLRAARGSGQLELGRERRAQLVFGPAREPWGRCLWGAARGAARAGTRPARPPARTTSGARRTAGWAACAPQPAPPPPGPATHMAVAVAVAVVAWLGGKGSRALNEAVPSPRSLAPPQSSPACAGRRRPLKGRAEARRAGQALAEEAGRSAVVCLSSVLQQQS